MASKSRSQLFPQDADEEVARAHRANLAVIAGAGQKAKLAGKKMNEVLKEGVVMPTKRSAKRRAGLQVLEPDEERAAQEPEISDFVVVEDGRPERAKGTYTKGRVKEKIVQTTKVGDTAEKVTRWEVIYSDMPIAKDKKAGTGPTVAEVAGWLPKFRQGHGYSMETDIKPQFDQDYTLDLERFLDEHCVSKTVCEKLTQDPCDPLMKLGIFDAPPEGAEDCYAAALFSAKTMNLVALCAKGNLTIDDLITAETYEGRSYDDKQAQWIAAEVDERVDLWNAAQGRAAGRHLRLRGTPHIISKMEEKDVFQEDPFFGFYPKCGFVSATTAGAGVCIGRTDSFILVLWWRGEFDLNGGNCKFYLMQAVEALCEKGYYHNVYR